MKKNGEGLYLGWCDIVVVAVLFLSPFCIVVAVDDLRLNDSFVWFVAFGIFQNTSILSTWS